MNNAAKPAYARIAESIAARIAADQFPTGQLPGERVLAAEYGVAYLTLRHAIALLRERRLITTRHGQASRILPPPDPAASHARPPAPAPR
jgi:DNA-binding GntR family transcriptional regulator